MILEGLKNKKVLILGLGKEGIDTLKFLRRLFPKKILGVGDKRESVKRQISNQKKIEWHLGKDYLKSIKQYDIIIKSPGIPIHLPEIERIFREKKITSQTEIFFDNCPGQIIGITGTKGKGTTASLIYRILKYAKMRVKLVGNIGKPALSSLLQAKSGDIFIYELSSHQLYRLKKSPKIAVLLNIYPAHLEYFKDFKEYLNTKVNITRHQRKSDYLVYNPKDRIVRKIAERSKAKKIPISTKLRNNFGLIGDFNLVNLGAAITLARLFKITNKEIIRALKGFRSAENRLEYVGKFKGIKFYNDSASTIPESAIAAILALKERVETLILGGSECNLKFDTLAKIILKQRVKNLILFPDTGQEIWQTIRRQMRGKNLRSLPRYFWAKNMPEAVSLAYQHTKKGRTCLLSPASPSFTLFQDYKERGILFKKYVKKIGSS